MPRHYRGSTVILRQLHVLIAAAAAAVLSSLPNDFFNAAPTGRRHKRRQRDMILASLAPVPSLLCACQMGSVYLICLGERAMVESKALGHILQAAPCLKKIQINK